MLTKWAALPPFLLLASAPFVVGTYRLDVLNAGVIYGLMAMGLAVLIGQAGLPSLGHAAFVGVGGYTAAVVANEISANPLVGLVLAGIAGAILSAVLGVMSLRSHGVFFLMISLALAELVHAAAISNDTLGGDNGLRMNRLEIPVLDRASVPHSVSMYWYALLIAAVAYLALRIFVTSPVGQAIAGSRDTADRMKALGYSVRSLRMAALVTSGVIVGLGGALLTQKDNFISPSALAPDTSILLLVMVLVGGATSLLGPFLAGVGLIFLRSWISSTIGEYWVIALGLVFVLTVYLLPNGFAAMIKVPALRKNRHEEAFLDAE